MKILQIKSSVFNGNGQSSRLADEFVARLHEQDLEAELIQRDLVADPVPHLDGARAGAFFAKPEERGPEQRAVIAYSDALIDELRGADVLVLGLPMYNFGIPSTLKAYFDHVARSGHTFRYTEKGPEGLLKGKKAVIFAARGGLYAGTPKDTQTGYVRDFLAFLGIEDVEFVYAEGLAMGEAPRKQALDTAAARVRVLANARPEALAQAA